STPGPMTLDDRFGQTTPTEPVDAWPGGHQAQVIADNTGTRPITRGTADRDLGGATVTGLRIGTHTVANGRITLRHAGSDGTLAAGATSSLGRTANGVAGTPAPRRTPA
ncbi:cellulose binding domain-containing protein, partial [Streptomyces sp. NPDC057417]